MHVAVGFMPAFKYRQKNSLIVFERGHKAHGYVSAGEASKIPTGGPPMTTRLSVTGDLLIWTVWSMTAGFSSALIERRYSISIALLDGSSVASSVTRSDKPVQWLSESLRQQPCRY